MKTLFMAVASAASVLSSGISTAQTGNMMDGTGMWGSGWMGGYGMSWIPLVLICIAFVGLVIWVISKNRK